MRPEILVPRHEAGQRLRLELSDKQEQTLVGGVTPNPPRTHDMIMRLSILNMYICITKIQMRLITSHLDFFIINDEIHVVFGE